MKDYSNYTWEEFVSKYEDYPNYMVKIVFDYYHRDRSYTMEHFAKSHNVSITTVYRYLNRIGNKED